MAYKVNFKEVELAGEATAKRVCETAHEMIKEGIYAFIIKNENGDVLLKADAFNNKSCGRFTSDTNNEWLRYCQTNKVWDAFDSKDSDGNDGITDECAEEYGLEKDEMDDYYDEYEDEYEDE